ncbi:52 kDa repressor of the inhibitor of the protein kinase-like [Neoarius graeffei]|uniref:52 kDa repressor of the inhibitor of the protein kinase-like n=1 Tax=Neoarius graeffei TaxID=443677 RepID=UPI00298CBE9E|nr:52 kDa repressor of the inhibitor of the protein kinase-like [Neoarius graeffei]
MPDKDDVKQSDAFEPITPTQGQKVRQAICSFYEHITKLCYSPQWILIPSRTETMCRMVITRREWRSRGLMDRSIRPFRSADLNISRSRWLLYILDRSHQETAEHNRHGIQAIIDLVSTCGQQNVALRGHTDERSNFQAFLKYRAKGDPTLKQYLQLAPANANYCGHQIQNEIIELCGKQIQNAILRKCRSAEWFSVILDETADVSNTEQVSILVHYVHHELGGYSVREDFLCFVSTADTTGEALTKVLLDKLTQLNLDPKNMVGQGYDGTGNISGKVRGVQARVRQLYPAATYVHCRNHALNLAIVHSTRIPLVRNILDSVQDIVAFLSGSPKRLQIFLGDQSAENRRLQKFSDTRWSQHDACISTVIENYEHIFVTLGKLQVEGDAKSCATATALSRSMELFDLLQYLTPLSNSLQNPDCHLPTAAANAAALVTLLQQKRDTAFPRLWEQGCALADKLDVNPMIPRIVRMQTKRSNTPAATPEEYWRLNLFLPFIDHLITEVTDRICLALLRLNAQYLLPDKLSALSDTLWHDIKEEYKDLMPNVNAVDTEMELWKQLNELNPKKHDICQVLETTENFYPNIHSILQVLLTMPVSTASAERSFSTLRHLKTYLHNTMSDTRLTGLALMNIHFDMETDSEEIMRQFDATGRRRINFK